MVTRTLVYIAGFAAAIFIVSLQPARAEMATQSGSTRGVSTSEKMTGPERRKKCSEEWNAAKAAGKTKGQKWTQFYGACKARVKGG